MEGTFGQLLSTDNKGAQTFFILSILVDLRISICSSLDNNIIINNNVPPSGAMEATGIMFVIFMSGHD